LQINVDVKILILTRKDHRSPRVLAESLQTQLQENGINAEILFDIDILGRLVSYNDSKFSFHFWLRKKLIHWFKDRRVIKVLKQADAVVISECIPNAFWKSLYNVEKLKTILKKPVFIYEVYWLANTPTQTETLQQNRDTLYERYDGHLFVSPVTEIRARLLPNTFCIGLMARSWNLQPLPKKELIALVDFEQPGYEAYRAIQINVLNKAGIPFISLERGYTIAEIRDIYRQVSIFFVQVPEAFGLPILECLCTGAQVFTPDSSWPMSWRLDIEPKVHDTGILPNCFTVYHGQVDLLQKLLAFKENFQLEMSPLRVFADLVKYYPGFYNGDDDAMKKFLEFIKNYLN